MRNGSDVQRAKTEGQRLKGLGSEPLWRSEPLWPESFSGPPEGASAFSM